MNIDPNYQRHYSDEAFRAKLLRFAAKAGRELVEKALQLFYALQSPTTPAWAKGVIIAALGYFICPVDAIPDFLPVIGFSDDLGIIIAALAAIAVHITPEMKTRARERVEDWFGPAPARQEA